MTIYKIATLTDWADAGRAGAFAGSAHDKADGFLHFSTASQLAETLRLYYAGANDILLVAVDETQLGAALKWEHAPSRGEDFPHLYGALPLRRCDGQSRSAGMPGARRSFPIYLECA